jgi:hypothetical protein
MRLASTTIKICSRLACVAVLCALAPGIHAQNKCSATGVLGGEKFSATNCAASVYTGADSEHGNSAAIWFNENPISADEASDFEASARADDKKDGKDRTLLVIMFCPGGGSSKASAAAVKSIDLHTNHAKSTFLGIQTVVESPKDFKVEKLTGEVKPGGALSGKITGSSGKTTFNLDFDVKLPQKEGSAGMGCGD